MPESLKQFPKFKEENFLSSIFLLLGVIFDGEHQRSRKQQTLSVALNGRFHLKGLKYSASQGPRVKASVGEPEWALKANHEMLG